MVRRGKLDIIADILRVAQGGHKKTKLVYETNLNFQLLGEYLEILLNKGFIFQYKKEFYTSDAGFQYLRYYDLLVSLYNGEDYDKPLSSVMSRNVEKSS